MKYESITECFVSNSIQDSTEIKDNEENTKFEGKVIQIFKSGNFPNYSRKKAFQNA